MGFIFRILVESAIRPGKWADRLTPWIFLLVGGGMVLLMVYSCAEARE